MSTTKTPDIFANVHKGIRRALFEVCTALGRAGTDETKGHNAKSQLKEVLHLVAFHGENEDVVLLPVLAQRAPQVFQRMQAAHEKVGAALNALRSDVDTQPAWELYPRLAAFISQYLEHMREEEEDLQPLIRAVISSEEIAGLGRASGERTATADRTMMLTWMLPALPRADAEEFLSRMPPAVAERLRSLTGA
ncbi:MAG: hemerythrin domain-containing protein [Myxococcota bacterium]